MKEYKIVYCGGEGEIVEKKSRFIATVKPVDSEEEASAFIAEMKKKYWDARHNCSAFVIGEGIHNTAVVVTRYFGGTLLGTGGLVRAYSKSVQAGLAASTVLEKKKGFLLAMETDYSGIGKIQYLLGQRGLLITDSQYTDKVTVETLVPQEELVSVKEEITEGTNGKTVFAKEEPVAYAFDGKTPVFF